MSGGPPHHPRQTPSANTAWNHLQVPNYFPTRQPQHAHMSNEHSLLQHPTWHTPTTEPMKPIPPSHLFNLEQMLSDRQYRHSPGVDLTLTRNGSQPNGDLPTTPISLSVRDANKINSLPVSAIDIQAVELTKAVSPGLKSMSPGLKPASPGIKSASPGLKPMSPGLSTSPGLSDKPAGSPKSTKRSNVRVDSILERLNPQDKHLNPQDRLLNPREPPQEKLLNLPNPQEKLSSAPEPEKPVPVVEKSETTVPQEKVVEKTPAVPEHKPAVVPEKPVIQSVIVQASSSSHDENSNSSSILNVPTPTNVREEDALSAYSNEDSLDSNKSRRKRKPSKTIRMSKDEKSQEDNDPAKLQAQFSVIAQPAVSAERPPTVEVNPIPPIPEEPATETSDAVTSPGLDNSKPIDENLGEILEGNKIPERRRSNSLDPLESLIPPRKTRRKTSSESETIANIAAMVQEGLECKKAEQEKLKQESEKEASQIISKAISVSVIRDVTSEKKQEDVIPKEEPPVVDRKPVLPSVGASAAPGSTNLSATQSGLNLTTSNQSAVVQKPTNLCVTSLNLNAPPSGLNLKSMNSSTSGGLNLSATQSSSNLVQNLSAAQSASSFNPIQSTLNLSTTQGGLNLSATPSSLNLSAAQGASSLSTAQSSPGLNVNGSNLNTNASVPISNPAPFLSASSTPLVQTAAQRKATTNFVEVENKLEEMFAGIDETLTDPLQTDIPDPSDTLPSSSQNQDVTSTSNDLATPKKAATSSKKSKARSSKTSSRRSSENSLELTPKKKKSNKKSKKPAATPTGGKLGKTPAASAKKGKKSVNGKQIVGKVDAIKDVYAYDSGSNTSSTKSKGPFIQIKGPRDSPISVSIVNTPTNDEDADKKVNKTKKFHDDTEYRHKVRSKGLHCSTLSNKYDAQTRDVSWICVFCKLGPHCTNVQGIGKYENPAVPPGDLFGPYIIGNECPEFERRLDDPYDCQFKSKKACRAVEGSVNVKITGKKSKRKHSESEKSDTASTTDVYLGVTETGDNTYEIWVHEECIVWSPGVYLVGPKIVGLEEAVWTACNVKCSKCVYKGANVCCLRRGCSNVMHIGCARQSDWQLDDLSYKAFCSEHKTAV